MDLDGFINPEPVVQPENQPFWDATKEDRFLVKWCNVCERAHWYPRARCPFCFSDDTAFREASGEGTIYAFAPMRRTAAPYILAYVTLAEGPTMMTNIVNARPEELTTGQPVRVAFVPTSGEYKVPVFTPT
ncbi:Zn-ribbon domain-containing OB-fold protein [Acuticoccus mangrovi]|uniref:OB-fold domain-containing protein n=1 Tax=Acuticoccus mangrovi TaxID=2796142 RepID=A0A934ISW4_9HYPH|nr:OB-fold domain-containing protein [Acuticoccus mangrovi]MBJ3777069.1 OB-fold domain-containing protein [Acuticoccus mangrovi]